MGPKKLGWPKSFDFRRVTPFCLEKRLSKHKMAIFSKNCGSMAPLPPWLRPCCVTGVRQFRLEPAQHSLLELFSVRIMWLKLTACQKLLQTQETQHEEYVKIWISGLTFEPNLIDSEDSATNNQKWTTGSYKDNGQKKCTNKAAVAGSKKKASITLICLVSPKPVWNYLVNSVSEKQVGELWFAGKIYHSVNAFEYSQFECKF